MINRFKLLLLLLPVSIIIGMPVNAAGIKKCQDAEGNWHYGDFADEACAERGDVTKLNATGNVIGVEKPPPTQQELDQKNKQKLEAALKKNQLEQQREKDKREKDKNVVQIYGSEEVIRATRDRKLESIDNNLVVTRKLREGIESDLAELKARKETQKVKKLIDERERAIQSYDQVIDQSLRERDKLVVQYDEIMKNFQEASTRLNSGG